MLNVRAHSFYLSQANESAAKMLEEFIQKGQSASMQ